MSENPDVDPSERAAAERFLARQRDETVPPAYGFRLIFKRSGWDINEEDLLNELNTAGSEGWRPILVFETDRYRPKDHPGQDALSGQVIVLQHDSA